MKGIEFLKRWRQVRPQPDARRWVVLDVESSGLDPRRDRLIAIAAIAVRLEGDRASIELADSFEVVLQQPEDSAAPDRQNVLLHSIGVGAQRAGIERAAALRAFLGFVGNSPLIAFHAAFDRSLLERACRLEGLAVPGNSWLDLEPLAAVLRPEVKARSLDDWMQALGIVCPQRHQAAADTLASAELLLMLWPALRVELPAPDFRAVVALAARRRWLVA